MDNPIIFFLLFIFIPFFVLRRRNTEESDSGGSTYEITKALNERILHLQNLSKILKDFNETNLLPEGAQSLIPQDVLDKELPEMKSYIERMILKEKMWCEFLLAPLSGHKKIREHYKSALSAL